MCDYFMNEPTPLLMSNVNIFDMEGLKNICVCVLV